MTSYDVAIIGGGAAGLSAAPVVSHARRSVLVIDAGSPRLPTCTAFSRLTACPPRDC